jgi:YcxB-like protein
MTITYKVSKEDFVAALQLNRSRGGSKISRINYVASRVVIMLMILIPLLTLALTRDPEIRSSAQEVALIGAFLAIGAWVVLPLVTPQAYARGYKFFNEITAEPSEEAIQMTGSTFEATFKWRHFYRFSESTKVFLVYQSPQFFNIFPKRAFAPGDAEQFHELLKRKLPSK